MQRSLRSFSAQLLGFLLSVSGAQAQGLDATFGANGKVFTAFTAAPTTDAASAVVLQPDGKVVVAGQGGAGLALARYNPNGSLDISFGTGGKVMLQVPVPDQMAACMTFTGTGVTNTSGMCLQADGKLVVVGDVSGRDSFVARFLANGTLDVAFGTNGLTYLCGSTAGGYAVRVSQQPTGQLLVLAQRNGIGGGSLPSAPRGFVFRLLANGALDGGYSANQSNAGPAYSRFADATVDSNGRAVVVGHQQVARNSTTGTFTKQLLVTRFTSAGMPDVLFGTNGVADAGPFAGLSAPARSVLELPDGKLLVLGASQGTTDELFMARYNTNGTFDSSFGTNGISNLGALAANDFNEMALQADGKVLLVGSVKGDFVFRRLLADGQTDNTFGVNGYLTVNEDADDVLNDVVIQPDGNAVAVGYSASAPGQNSRFAVLRVLRGGVVSASLGQTSLAKSLRIVPNPTTKGETLRVEMDWASPVSGPVVVELLSVVGAVVATATATSTGPEQLRYMASLPAQALPAGLYLLRAQSAHGTLTGRVAVQ